MIQRHKAFVFIVVVVSLIIGVVLQACAPVQADSKSILVSTPQQDIYIEAFITFVKQLEQEGLITAKEIRVENSQPFVFILKSQEITDEDVKNIVELAVRTVSAFESGGGLKHDDIDIAFRRPVQQKILLIKRRNMPELLSASEATVVIDQTNFMSLVNLAGPIKSNSQEFGNSWAVVQAICLAYGASHEDSDAICNIVSANASAAWVGMDEKQAAQLINDYGMTHLDYLGSKDYRYRFIDFVYRAFIH